MLRKRNNRLSKPWLAVWAQNRRRRRLRLARPLSPAPVLRSEYPDKLAWDWSLENPYKWNVWHSLDGGATYLLADGYWMYGDARQFAPDGPGELHYIVGIDEAGNEITEHSNAVRPDDALPPIDLLSDLFAYWKMEEEEGYPRYDSHIVGVDLAEWDRNGGEITIGQTGGVIGNAALFTDGADVGLIHRGLDAWNNAADFTVSGWFRYTANNFDSQYLLTVGNNLQIAVRPNEAAVNIYVVTDGPDGYFRVQTADSSLFEGAWVHFAAVRSGHTFTIYLNGAARASGTPLAWITPINESLPDLHIGCAPFGYPLNGAIDELGVWKRALTAAEIALLYNNGDGLTYEQF